MTQRGVKRVFGLPFATMDTEAIAAAVAAPFADGPPRRLYTANLDHIVKLRQDAAFADAYAGAWMVTADGTPVWAYARWRSGAPVKRVTGSDLLPAILARLDPAVARPAFLCATDRIAAAIAADLAYRGFAGDRVLTRVPAFGFDRDPAQARALADEVAAHRTTHLFLGVGAPRSEIWAWRQRDRIGPAYVFPVGAGIAFHVGLQGRAPALFRRTGMEWSWRLMQEPRRLARRYLVDSWSFLGAIRDDLNNRYGDK